MITLNNLSKRYGEKAVIQNLTATLPQQGILLLMGASGCGKTTLLRLFAGLEAADGGSITVHAKKTALSFQEPRLIPWLTAKENINFVLSEEEICSKKAEELLAAVELSAHANDLPHTLSGGEKQRLSLARALAAKAELLLLDEPFAGLDGALVCRMAALIKEANKDGLTVVVSHDREDAARLGATLLQAVGTPLSALQMIED